MKHIIEIANGVVGRLNDYGAVFSPAPDFETRAIVAGQRHVVVVPTGRGMKIATRNTCEQTFDIDVGVVCKMSNGGVEEHIPVMEDIAGRMICSNVCGATCVSAKFEPLYLIEGVRSGNRFIGVVQLQFKAIG